MSSFPRIWWWLVIEVIEIIVGWTEVGILSEVRKVAALILRKGPRWMTATEAA